MGDLKKGCQIQPFTSYTSRAEFTKIRHNFAWGAATAAYQVNSHILHLDEMKRTYRCEKHRKMSYFS